MAIKRNTFLKRMALIGIDLGQISVKLTFYVVIAAMTLFLGGAFLVINLPSSEALTWYIIIMVLTISLQIARMIRLDREHYIWEGFMTDMDYFIHNGRKSR